MRPSSQPRERIPERRGLGKILDHRILSLFWRRPYLVLLPFIVLAFRSTLINGLIYPLRNTRFKGDFSAALFDGAQLGYCYPTSPDHIDPMGIVQTREGIWVEAIGPPEALLVNAGDLLELWSGGKFVSTPHQVVNRTNSHRYSAPYFAVPNHGAVVAPLIQTVPGFDRDPVPVGQISAEVWRTNWPDEDPSAVDSHLGTLIE